MNIETAGARLKKIRQERGLTLEDVQKKTKIHLNVLRAVEGDSLSNLSPVYLKSFIKLYCKYLGLDPREYTGQTGHQPKPELNAPVDKDTGECIEKKPAFIRDTSIRLGMIQRSAAFKKIIIFALSALAIIFLAFNLIKFFSSASQKLSEVPKVTIPNAPAEASLKGVKNASSLKSAIIPQTNLQKKASQGFVLGLFARDKSWISVKIDGKLVFHGVLARGRSKTWPAKEKIELSLGDAGAV